MPREIEIKFLVNNAGELRRRLRAAKFRQMTRRTFESNTLYDLPGQALRKRGELLRLRRYGASWLLTHKARSTVTRYKSRVETQTGVDNGEQLEKILRALGYVPSFRYEKFRAEWNDGQGHVVLDDTPIGFFGEIEGPPRWIDQTARLLGIDRQSYITKSYAELFFTWKQRTGSRATEMTFAAVPKSPQTT